MKSIRVYVLLALVLSLYSCGDFSGFGSLGENDFGNELGGDQYNKIVENPFVKVEEEPVSTFSIDADGASYANVRRYIQQEGRLPVRDAIRTEEFINYFDLGYSYVHSQDPISLNGEVSPCPWNPENKLIRIGIQGKPIPEDELPRSNYVFLLDISGSMSSGDKLDLLKKGFLSFVDVIKDDDQVAIVTYGSSSGVALKSTPGSNKKKIREAISKLDSGGGTAGADGIITAYEIAGQNFVKGGNNRVILGTDGDFNIGPSSQDELVKLIEEKRENGIFLTVLGVGRGNYKDGAMEQLANNGNGTYEYLDKVEQLEKVFIHEKNKFFTVAKDVKVQVEFNPDNIDAYRLIGYENRLLANEDFEDDKKDAGEIGSDQNITALYEIVPKNNPNFRAVSSFTIDFRYKEPDSDVSKPLELDIYDRGLTFEESTDFMKFTSSIASYAMLLRDSKYKAESNYDDIISILNSCNLKDEHGYKAELLQLVKTSKDMP